MREHAIRCLNLAALGARKRPDAWDDSGLCDACLGEKARIEEERAGLEELRREAAAQSAFADYKWEVGS